MIGSADVLGLTVDGQTISVAGQPNQSITLVDGTRIIINEQSSSANGNTGSMDVNALHVIAAGVADVTISAAHADITCPSAPPTNTPTATPRTRRRRLRRVRPPQVDLLVARMATS